MLDDRLDQLTKRLGFDRDGDVIARRGLSFRLGAAGGEVASWRTLAWSVWTCRIVVDQVTSTYDVTTERAPKKARNIYEVASRYGDRERWLVPRPVADTAAQLADKPFVEAEWVDDRFCVLLGLTEGLGVHHLGQDELDAMPFDSEDVWEKARLAHFYASYKARPVRTEKLEDGKLKFFETVDGRTASRALLLPDFDWDAAQDGGCLFIPGRDSMVIGEPFGADRAAAIDTAAIDAIGSNEAPDIPYYPTLYRLGPKSVERALEGWDDPFEPPPARLPIDRLA